MIQPVQRPVVAPYRSDVHSAAWALWDSYIDRFVAEGYPRNLVDTDIGRKIFMDAYILGLQTPEY